MPKTFLPWLRGSLDLNKEQKKPVDNKAKVEKSTDAKTDPKPDVKKTSALDKLRSK